MRYRRLIPMTHEQYLDEPPDVVTWALRIDEIEREIEAEEAKRNATPGSSGVPGRA